jgi:hypothetical protein
MQQQNQIVDDVKTQEHVEPEITFTDHIVIFFLVTKETGRTANEFKHFHLFILLSLKI